VLRRVHVLPHLAMQRLSQALAQAGTMSLMGSLDILREHAASPADELFNAVSDD